ncbi:MAG TPA: UDPGP type 1 family protein [Phycisphaerales bacterium]|nr:UDPGP type 1 family protein [Phycisphaerales bacterium]
MDLLDRVRARLTRVDQSHVLNFYPKLPAAEQRALLAQIDSIDLEALPSLVNEYVLKKPGFVMPSRLEPVKYYPHDPKSSVRAWDQAAAKRAGDSLIRAGKVAAFVVAGGQGSRLGFEGPKGCFPAGAVTNKTLFQIFAEGVLGTQDRAEGDVVIPWYIMTSPLNHEATTSFFESHKFFGLRRDQVMFFQQGVMPSLDIKTGKMLLASPHEVATNPDGHGGSIRALQVSGALADMQRRGVEHLSYFQVDNPMVRVIDPVFLGLHASAPDSSAEMSSKMVAKVEPGEKVGVFCLTDGKTEILEYSDMPKELKNARNADGSLTYKAGNIAVHALSRAFIERVATDAKFSLPCHRAEKKIPCVDPVTGSPLTPSENNGVKLEKFIFDALALCKQSLVAETDRVEEFAPIKNATGVDSVESSKGLQTLRAARWLEAAGVDVPKTANGSPDCVLEISGRTALCAEDLRGAKLPRIERGASVAI